MTQITVDTIELPKSPVEIPTHLFPSTHWTGSIISLKSGLGASIVSSSSTFWGNFHSHSTNDIAAAYVSVNTTTRTTVLDVTSGKGILTNVIGPQPGAQGYVSVWITIDGVEREWYGRFNTTTRWVLGGFVKRPVPVTSTSVADQGRPGSAKDLGEASSSYVHIITPEQALSLGVGIPFLESLKVEVQVHGTANATTYENNAGAAYVKHY